MASLSPEDYRSAMEAATARSVLAPFPDAVRRSVLDSSRRIDVPAKAYLRRPDEPERFGMVVRGLVRTTHVTEEGHELTTTWCHPGAVINALTLTGHDPGLYIQAVTAAAWCDFDLETVRHILRTDVQSAWLALTVLEDRLRRSIDELALFAYGDLRTRVRRKLLEIACREPDKRLIAPVTQEELASGVGAARPSVAKILGELRRAGAIRSTRDGIVILKPEALLKDPRRIVAA